MAGAVGLWMSGLSGLEAGAFREEGVVGLGLGGRQY